MSYQSFLESKESHVASVGIDPVEPHPMLFEYQKDIVKWSLKLGRACLWEDCGLGKTFQQIEWARQIPGDVLILAPLAVASQTVAEGAKIGCRIKYCRDKSEVEPGITIANYEMLEHFDCSRFAGVVLDESSILKAFMGKTKQAIINAFRSTQYKLACTATPAPNDHMEIGNHAEFLGVMNSNEMLARYFINDPAHVGRYRLKGHAEGAFWKWVASWAVMIRKPSDLGYSDEGFTLPPMTREWVVVDATKAVSMSELEIGEQGTLFALPASSMSERIAARRHSVNERADKAIALANRNDEQWIVWCALNAESELLTESINGAVQVVGSDSIEKKTAAMLDFAAGKVRVLVSKPSICGFGMNFQNCRNMVFVGLSDSWEQYYQAVRRCWRFGQNRNVNVYIVTASTEGAVVQNILRKETDAVRMSESIAKEMAYISTGAIHKTTGFKQAYSPRKPLTIPSFLCPQS